MSATEFPAAWQVLGELHGPPGWNWRTDAMPRHNRMQGMAAMAAEGLHFGVDILCRCIAPASYRNTMQASREFMRLNTHALDACKGQNLATGRRVNAVRLTVAAAQAWTMLSPNRQDELLSEWRLAIRGALADGGTPANGERLPVAMPHTTETPEPVLRARPLQTEQFASVPPKQHPATPPADLVQLVASEAAGNVVNSALRAMVEWVQREPFQPRHRRGRPVGRPVLGWDGRLLSYFWPSPEVDYACERRQFAEFCAVARPLAEAIERRGTWDKDECRAAVDFAERVFTWGGMRGRSQPTPRDVFRVFVNALYAQEHYPNAPMGTGWSKVACFATAHLEGISGRMPQTIWDSRVCNSLTWRLDQLLHAAGVRSLPGRLRDLTIVPGRGGSRVNPRPLRLGWRRGPMTWACQFEATRIVVRIRDILNAGTRPGPGLPYPRCHCPTGASSLGLSAARRWFCSWTGIESRWHQRGRASSRGG